MRGWPYSCIQQLGININCYTLTSVSLHPKSPSHSTLQWPETIKIRFIEWAKSLFIGTQFVAKNVFRIPSSRVIFVCPDMAYRIWIAECNYLFLILNTPRRQGAELRRNIPRPTYHWRIIKLTKLKTTSHDGNVMEYNKKMEFLFVINKVIAMGMWLIIIIAPFLLDKICLINWINILLSLSLG